MSKVSQIGITKINNGNIKNVNEIKVLEGKGIEGDRHFHEDNDVKNQITLIESENIDFYNKKFETSFSYIDFRRNLITKNIKLNELVGKKISVGEIHFFVHDLCRPCKHLQEKLGKDNIIKEFLKKGGVRCEILNSGKIRVGDSIKII